MNSPRKKLFLSYRRDDSSGYTELLFTKLTAHYGRAAVFRDVHAIHPADRFRQVIEESLAECAVVLVVISRQWDKITDVAGVPRIMKPDDVLCQEIATALKLEQKGLKLVPVLVGRASMPKAEDLPENIRALRSIQSHEISDQRLDHDFEDLVKFINSVAPIFVPPTVEVNPFSIRGGIRNDLFFHDREQERRMLRDYLRGRQNCQIVGPRRIGKSSLLLYIERHCVEWSPTARVSYIDLQDPRCFTMKGWLKEIAHDFRLPRVPEGLSDLMELIEDLLTSGVHPVLCLDEFGEMARRRTEFPREVFLTLRACGQRGMSILSAAPKRLSELTDPSDDTSPFFNTFPVLPLRPFAPVDARAYLDLDRPGVPAFTEGEKDRILDFAQGHPFALETACFHVLAARESGEDLRAALARAREDCGSTAF